MQPRPDSAAAAAPLSSIQERLWVLDRLGAGSAYNTPAALWLDGPLDATALERSLAFLVQRHAVLRSALRLENGQLVQRAMPAAELILERFTLLAEAERQELLERLVERECARPFDLAEPPLLRAALVACAAERHLLLVVAHHAASDAASMGTLLDDLWSHYAALTSAAPAHPSTPVGQYADYARWRRAEQATANYQRRLDFWRAQLSGLKPLELPLDRPRPQHRTFRCAVVDLTLPAELAAGLRALAARQRASPAMLFGALWAALLARLSDRTDLAVAVPFADRIQPEHARTVGPLLDLLVWRIDLGGDPSIAAELLKRVRLVALDAFEQGGVAFEDLVRELDPQRDSARPPLAQVGFCWHKKPEPPRRVHQLAVSDAGLTRQRATLDLELRVLETPAELPLRFYYDPDLFNATTVQALAARFVRCAEAIVSSPDVRLSQLPILSDEERRLWRVGDRLLPGCPAPSEAPVCAIARHARQAPQHPAVRLGTATLSYGQLWKRSGVIAAALARQGLRRDGRVGIALTPALDLPAALIAVHRLGAAYVPLDARDPAPRLAQRLASAGVSLVLVDGHWPSAFPAGLATIDVAAIADCAAIENSALPQDDLDIAPDALAYVIHTSGSTGAPKAVAIEQQQLAAQFAGAAEALQVVPEDVFLALAPLTFDIAALELLGILALGGTVGMVPAGERQDPQAIARAIESTGATLAQAAATTWRMIAGAGWSAPRPMRLVCGGEPLTRDLADRLTTAPGVELFNAYGTTETTVWSVLERVDAREITLGRPIAHSRLWVLDAHGGLMPPGVPGELCVGGAVVGRGYDGDPERSAERFRPDPVALTGRIYRSGDRGRLRRDGRFEFLGRTDLQFKLRGQRIELSEVEAVLSACPGVAQAVADVRLIGAEQLLLAWIVPQVGTTCDSAQIAAHLAEQLPPLLRPARIESLASIPRTTSGKVDRRALPTPAQTQAGRAPSGPQGALEQWLADLWCELLGLTHVDRQARFVDLGGHSLLAIHAGERLRSALGVQLSPLDLLFTDLASLAARCAPAAAEDGRLARWVRAQRPGER